MIDMHTHILPGIDDGSKSVEMSLEMLQRSARQGVSTVVATPHFYPRYNAPERFLEERAAAVERLGELPEEYPQLILGAEVAYYDGMRRSEELSSLQIGDTGMILIEMPFHSWTPRMMDELRDLQANLGLTPVLAHVNRYLGHEQFFHYCQWMEERGILFQCNTEAFMRIVSRRRMLKLLKQGKLHFLGSDTHDLDSRGPNMGKAAKIITQKLGRETLEEMTAFGAQMLDL